MLKITTVCQNHKRGRILWIMSIFAKVVPAKIPRTEHSKQIAFIYAGVLVFFAITQLFTFDEFLEYFPSIGLPFGEGFTYSLAAIIVAAEVFAIPFLLRMSLSPAFRWASMLLGWFVALFWMFISLWVLFAVSSATSVAFVGGLAELLPGWWAIFLSLALGAMSAWSSWGLWPGPLAFPKK